MNQATILARWGGFLRERGLKLTNQRRRVFDRTFDTHEHFTAETLCGWLSSGSGPQVSRATVYRTLGLLVEGGFLESLDTGQGEVLYEHVMGHRHHDHIVCLGCGRIEEFYDSRIERLQEDACRKRGFTLAHHQLRLEGYCRSCARESQERGAGSGV